MISLYTIALVIAGQAAYSVLTMAIVAGLLWYLGRARKQEASAR